MSQSRPCGIGEETDTHLWNKTKNLERDSPTYAQLILTKCKSTPMEKEHFFSTNGATETGLSTGHTQKINSK